MTNRHKETHQEVVRNYKRERLQKEAANVAHCIKKKIVHENAFVLMFGKLGKF